MESNLQYANKDYWDKRFETEDNFEWLTDFDAFSNLVLPHIRTDSRILHIGCGSSQMSMRLYDLGFKNVVNVDYSQVLVDAGKLKHPHMEWVCDDIRSLDQISTDSVDVVLEKATLEALLVAEKSQWEPSDYALNTLDSVFRAVHRVLKPDGIFLSISFTQPHFRVPALLRQPDWSVQVDEFGVMFHYLVYVARKGEQPSDDVRSRYTRIAPSWLRAVDQTPHS